MKVVRAGMLATILVLLCVAVFRSSAQSRQESQQQDFWVRSVENASQIIGLQKFAQRMEEAQIPERIARIEEKLSWLEWAVKALLGGVALLLFERLKAVIDNRKKSDE